MSPSRAPTVVDIAEHLGAGAQVLGLDESIGGVVIRRAAPVTEAREGDITFIHAEHERALALLQTTSATLVLVHPDVGQTAAAPATTLMLTFPNPRLAFIRVLRRFFSAPRPRGIDPRAVIAAGTCLAASAYVGPLATIGEDVSIGERTVVHAGVHVYRGCTIGADCTIGAGAVIGSDGFGYERNEHGIPERFPHVGTVVIEDDVEIGANTCIDRGTLGATIIRSHARIDDLVYIAHNVEVGQASVVVGLTTVAGGARLGEQSWIAPSSVIRDGVNVGEGAVVGLGSVVVGDVPAGASVAGAPARELAEVLAANTALRELVADKKRKTTST